MQKKLNQNVVRTANPVLWCVIVTFAWTLNLGAEGFRNPPPGAFNLGRAGGRIAQIDDSSAVQQNPANLVDLTNAEAQLAPAVVYIRSSFEGPSGQSARTIDSWKLLPNAFITMPLKDDKIAIGLGITEPYGLGGEWDQNSSAFQSSGALRYQSPYFAQLQTININPTISLRLNDKLSIGAGFDVMWSDLEFKQFYSWLPFGGTTDGNAKLEGDGFGYGGNIGLTWKVTDHQRFAVTYRSPMTVHYSGHADINNIPAAATFMGVTPESDFHTKIRFPTIVAAGYGIELNDKIRLETDFEWIQFSRFNSLDLGLGNNAILLGSAAHHAENWKDTFTAGVGGDWKFADDWVLRAGYQFYQSPVPDSTFSPSIPDADQNVFTVGLGYKHGHHSLEAAYGLDFYNTRNITSDQNPAFNGKYTFTVHLFSFAYRYSF
jgi:long-chain fatty acid transport protein